MCSVHIDDDKSVFVLGEYVDAGQLRNRVPQGRNLRHRLRQRTVVNQRLTHPGRCRSRRQRHRTLVKNRLSCQRNRHDIVATRPRVLKCHLDGLRHNAMYTTTIAKTDLVLGRMRIRVNAGRVQGQIQDVGRVTTVKQDVTIGMPCSVRQSLVRNTAAIDEPVLHIRLATMIRRQREPA